MSYISLLFLFLPSYLSNSFITRLFPSLNLLLNEFPDIFSSPVFLFFQHRVLFFIFYFFEAAAFILRARLNLVFNPFSYRIGAAFTCSCSNLLHSFGGLSRSLSECVYSPLFLHYLFFIICFLRYTYFPVPTYFIHRVFFFLLRIRHHTCVSLPAYFLHCFLLVY